MNWVAAAPIDRGGGKSGLHQDRVLGNAQAPAAASSRLGTESGTETYRPASGGSRVKSDGKSVRPTAVTRRRLNPTWSKAK